MYKQIVLKTHFCIESKIFLFLKVQLVCNIHLYNYIYVLKNNCLIFFNL